MSLAPDMTTTRNSIHSWGRRLLPGAAAPARTLWRPVYQAVMLTVRNREPGERATLVLIHLLGPVKLTGHTCPRLRSDKARLILASLALDVGRPVPLDELVHRLWEDEMPLDPRQNVHTYISRLRDAFKHAQPGPDCPGISQHAHTYVLDANPDSVDWHRYRRLTDRAKEISHDGDDIRAAAEIHAADQLWKGPPLAGLPGSWADMVRTDLEERRRGVTAARVAMELRLERYSELAGELTTLIERHPADEALVSQFMVACYGCGRNSDALRAYEHTRNTVRAEYGTDVGVELARVHRGILQHAPLNQLTHRPGSSGTDRRPVPPPDNLPRHTPLVGRSPEMRRLRSAVSEELGEGTHGSVITVESISGMAGVGKSSLALNAADELADQFPDGRLFVNLCTHHPSQPPLDAGTALAILLRDLGVQPQSIPGDTEGRAALWRRKLADKRLLLILDDVAGPDQIRPLLPGGSPTLTLLTSRRRLTGLPGARSLALDVLPESDAVTLFRSHTETEHQPYQSWEQIGSSRSSSSTSIDFEEINRIVELCGYLPLAIEIAASRLTVRPSWTLAALRKRLERAPGRLGELRDGYREVAGVFEMSYQALSESERSAFRVLSLHPGPDFGPHAAAALLGTELEETERLLESLLTSHLLQEPTPHRFRFHDLLGEYAHILFADEEGPSHRQAALRRLTDFYIRAADHCDRLVYPRRVRVRIPRRTPRKSTQRGATGNTPPSPPFDGQPAERREQKDAESRRRRAGRTAHQRGKNPPLDWETPLPWTPPEYPDVAHYWFDTELPSLLAAEQHARQSMPDRAALLSHVLTGYLEASAHWAEATGVHQHAVDHWRDVGDEEALCYALLNLSTARSSTACYTSAVSSAQRALDFARASGDDHAKVEALRILGVVHWHLGEKQSALSFQEAALELASSLNMRWTVARCHDNLGITLLHMAEHSRAAPHFEKALNGFRAVDDMYTFAKTLNNLGDLYSRTDRHESARQAYEESLRIARTAGCGRADIAITQANIAKIEVERGDTERGKQRFAEILPAFRALGDRKNEAAVLSGLAWAYLGAGETAAAGNHAYEALAVVREIKAADEEAHALRLLGQIEAAADRPERAETHLLSAISVAREVGTPDEEARAECALADLRHHAGSTEEARSLWEHAFRTLHALGSREAENVRARLNQQGD